MSMDNTFVAADAANVYAALARARRKFTPIARRGSNPEMGYTYATLNDIIAGTDTALSREGLSVIQPVSRRGNEITITTILAHQSGASLSSVYSFPCIGAPQADGAQITFYRRYAYKCILGVAEVNEADIDSGRQPILPASDRLQDQAIIADSSQGERGDLIQAVHRALNLARGATAEAAATAEGLLHAAIASGSVNDLDVDGLRQLLLQIEPLTQAPAPTTGKIAA
jgi:hypothetical protein